MSHALDPAVEAVLRDIAADPRAKLFVVDPAKLVHGLSAGSLSVSVQNASLAPAEKHLLAVYRNEVALALFMEVNESLLANPAGSLVCTYARPTHAERSTHVRQLIDVAVEGDQGTQSAIEALTHQTKASAAMRRSILLSHAIQVGDSPSLRTLAASHQLAIGNPAAALLLARRVIDGRPSLLVRKSALECAGLALIELGQRGRAAECFQSSLAACERLGAPASDLAIPLVSLLVHDVVGVREADARRRSLALDELGSGAAKVVATATTKIGKRHDARWTISVEADTLARKLQQAAGPNSSEVLNALI